MAGTGPAVTGTPAGSAGRSTDVDLLAVVVEHDRVRALLLLREEGAGQGGLAELAGGVVAAEDRGRGRVRVGRGEHLRDGLAGDLGVDQPQHLGPAALLAGEVRAG